MEDSGQKAAIEPLSSLATPLLSERVLMTAFWMLLGGAAGIKVMQNIWHLLGVDVGVVTIAVPVRGVGRNDEQMASPRRGGYVVGRILHLIGE
jgi:hypothetical protein